MLYFWQRKATHSQSKAPQPSARKRAARPRCKLTVELLESRLAPAVLTVNTTLDSVNAVGSEDNVLTLREALTSINNQADVNLDATHFRSGSYASQPGGTPDVIDFNIPGNKVQTILVGASGGGALPTITRPLTIDGYSDLSGSGGASPNTSVTSDNARILVELNGANAGGNSDGLNINIAGASAAAHVVIDGLAIDGFSHDGIELFSGFNVITGCFVGTDPTGTTQKPNLLDGISVEYNSNNQIGGTTLDARNLVSGNQNSGIHITGTPGKPATGNVVQGNFVGVNVAGTGPVGTQPSNAIAPNQLSGNFLDGIEISGGSGNSIGGTTVDARNVVGFNYDGISLDNGAQNNTIQGNLVGVGADGTTPTGNIAHGIALHSAGHLAAPFGPGQANEPAISGNLIGGPPGSANIIEFNGQAGVAVFGNPLPNNGTPAQNSGNAIEGNSIYQNGRDNPSGLLGIDLSNKTVYPTDDGPTANDGGTNLSGKAAPHGDPSDPNNFQNAPVLTSAEQVGASVLITGTLTQSVSPNATYRIDFFANNPDPQGGIPEGQIFLGSTNAPADANGVAPISATLFTTVTAGQLITATATILTGDPSSPTGSVNINNTSEFSAPVVANQAAISSANATTFTAGVAGSFTVTALGAQPLTLTESGTLPSGVTFVDNHNGTATLAGTPAAGSGGAYPLTILAQNGVGGSATQTFTLTVNEAPAFTSSNSASFSVGTQNALKITTLGFPRPKLTESGPLPSGVTFTDNGDGTATLAGTPGAASGGTYSFTLTAHNSSGADATQGFTLSVSQGTGFTSADSTLFAVGIGNFFKVTATGFPTPTQTESGALPPGVSFNAGTGILSGTPAAGSGRRTPITFTATNSIGSVSQNFTLTVLDAPLGVDFGSAPDGASFPAPNTYPTLLADDGARHIITALKLGNTITASTDGQPSANATSASADGITFISALTIGGTAAIRVNVQGTGTNGAFLDGWIDFKGDGSWSDAGDQILASAPVVNGDNVLTFTLPASATISGGSFTFARFRLSSAGGLTPTGLAADGEVEDYRVQVASAPGKVYVNPSFTGRPGTDPDGSGPAVGVGYDAFATIQQALNVVGPGGVVVVAAGTYAENLTLSRPVVLQGAGSGTTVLSGSATGTGLNVLVKGGAAISGLTVKGFNVGLSAAAATTYLSLTDVHFKGNKFGSVVVGVNVFLYQGSGTDTIFANPLALAQPGDDPLWYKSVGFLTVDGGTGSNTLDVFLNDITTTDTVWDTGTGLYRKTGSFLMFYRDSGGTFGGGVTLILSGTQAIVVEGQQTGAPLIVYANGGTAGLFVDVNANSAYQNLTIDGGGTGTLQVVDSSGNATGENFVLPDGTGEVIVSYGTKGAGSTIHFQNVNGATTNFPEIFGKAPSS